MGGEGEQQRLVGHQMLHDRRQEIGLGRGLADLSDVDTGESQEPVEPLRLSGKEAERPGGHGLCKFLGVFTPTQRHGLPF